MVSANSAILKGKVPYGYKIDKSVCLSHVWSMIDRLINGTGEISKFNTSLRCKGVLIPYSPGMLTGSNIEFTNLSYSL